jgi:hypothetical protein
MAARETRLDPKRKRRIFPEKFAEPNFPWKVWAGFPWKTCGGEEFSAKTLRQRPG